MSDQADETMQEEAAVDAVLAALRDASLALPHLAALAWLVKMAL